jgi:uncharacterized protein YdhG (YjbR/CyaY superfamily)
MMSDVKKTARAAGTKKPAKSTADAGKPAGGFTEEEREAMKARIQEMKEEARSDKNRADGTRAVVAALAKMPEADRALGERLHAIISAGAPSLVPKLWYGMPAYATSGGKIVCFFQGAAKFKTRYATFAFMHEAKLDEGAMWPTGFAVTGIAAAEEARIVALLKKAAG